MGVHLLGLLYNQFSMTWTLYVWVVLIISLIGLLFFMIFIWTLRTVK